MKKRYQQPELEIKEMILDSLMDISGNLDGQTEFEFEGDDDGTHDPDAKRFSVWD